MRRNFWKTKTPVKNKYGNKTAIYNEYRYDSQKEANYAAQLDWRKKAGEILEITRQHKLSLDIGDDHICNYYVDFKIELADGRIEYHEVKGWPTPEWKIKWKLAQAIYGAEKFVLIQ